MKINYSKTHIITDNHHAYCYCIIGNGAVNQLRSSHKAWEMFWINSMEYDRRNCALSLNEEH